MGYYRDLTKVSIDEYKEFLKTADLLKSRMILKDHVNDYFDLITHDGINSIGELQKKLKYKKNAIQFGDKLDIPEEYILILRRELNSYLPTPNSIYDFIVIPEDVKEKLIKEGINNTYELFEHIKTEKNRQKFQETQNISDENIDLLKSLTDISRIRWVNHTFACILYDLGYDSLIKVQNADYNQLHEEVNKYNDEKGIYKGKIGLHDMKLVVDEAKYIDHDIE